MNVNETVSEPVSLCGETDQEALATLLARYGLDIDWVERAQPIPGSFWGAPEAGLIDNTLYLRGDTPVHSALHEACHYICMSPARRNGLHTDAGGGYDEENAVCYLQILLADALPEIGATRLMADMDAWGYSFRLGSAQAWFEHDAGDARQWLTEQGIIDENRRPTWQLRQSNDPLPAAVPHGI